MAIIAQAIRAILLASAIAATFVGHRATALGSPDIHQALCFLISWPALEKAAAAVLGRAKELNSDHYEILSSTVDALAGKHPLVATLLLRSMCIFHARDSS